MRILHLLGYRAADTRAAAAAKCFTYRRKRLISIAGDVILMTFSAKMLFPLRADHTQITLLLMPNFWR